MNNRIELDLTDKQRFLIMLPLMLGSFIAMLNETIINIAFPKLTDSLSVTTGTLQWLVSLYMLIIGILVPVTAFLQKKFSTRALFFSAMFIFTLGTIACGLAQSFPALLVSRIIQGAGAGMTLPIAMNAIMEIYPVERRGTAIGTGLIVVVVAPTFGPSLAGLVLQYLDWHWLFFLILPFAFLAVALGFKNLKNVTVLTNPKIDVLSIFLSTIGFGGLIFGISSAENLGFFNAVVVISLFCGIVGLIVFSLRQLKLKEPLLELRAFRFPMFTLGTVLMFIAFMIPIAVNIILPTYTQVVMGLTPFTAGLALLPGNMLGFFLAPASGRIYDRIGARTPLIVGFAALVIGMCFLARISSSTTLIMLIAMQICITIGINFIFTPTQTNSLNYLPRDYYAHGIAILNTMLQIGAAFGSTVFIGLMGAIQARHLGQIENPTTQQVNSAMISSVDVAFTAALIVVTIGLILSFFIKRREKIGEYSPD
jgi:MFS transporter, DHA2 family, lincomycin resistance protein